MRTLLALALLTGTAHAQILAFSSNSSSIYQQDNGYGFNFALPLNNGATYLTFNTTERRQWVRITLDGTCDISSFSNGSTPVIPMPTYAGIAQAVIAIDGKYVGGYAPYCAAQSPLKAMEQVQYDSYSLAHMTVMAPVGPGKHVMQVTVNGTSVNGTSGLTANWFLGNTSIVVDK